MLLNDSYDEIVEYTKQNPELQKAHHYLFDLPIGDRNTKADCIVIGVNPGEGKSDKKIADFPLEETRKHDFHEARGTRKSTMRWLKNVSYYCEGMNVVQTEFFLWSSKNMGNAFVERYGCPLDFAGDHLRFCAKLNEKLIDFHAPRLVVAPGLSAAPMGVAYYGLKHLETIRDAVGHRLAEKFRDTASRDWLFTKHWSGSYGLSTSQKSAIKEIICSY